MPEAFELKPAKAPFVNWRFLKKAFWIFVFFLIVFTLLKFAVNWPIYPFLIVFIIILVVLYISLSIAYKKENYIVYADKIIHKSGGLFSDKETELVIQNITHITLRLPWIENKIFKTGNILIESAGTGLTEIKLSSINNSRDIYEKIMDFMRAGGFKLNQDKPIQEERPSSLGVFFEVFRGIMVVIFFILYMGFHFMAAIQSNTDFFKSNSTMFVAIALVVVGFLLLKAIFNFLDLKRRVYQIYSTQISYSEGFLTKNYSVIPIENLADSTVNQTLIDQIFNLYDITISCQGSKQEIHFKNMRNGKKLEKVIDGLIGKSRSLVGTGKKAKKVQQEFYKTAPVARDTTFTGQYSMSMFRSIIPLLLLLPIFIALLPVIFFWFFWLIMTVIKVSVTKYYVKAQSLQEDYDFITSRHKEFNLDKITGIVVTENFMDKWTKTFSIQFWSIGSSNPIKFSNIKKDDELMQKLLAKTGIKTGKELHKINSHYDFGAMLMSVLGLTILMIIIPIFAFILVPLTELPLFIPIIVLICIIILYVIAAIYKSAFYKRSLLTFYKDCIHFQKGIFFKSYYYVTYDNVKDITILKWPGTHKGNLRFNVAGEHIVSGDNQGKSRQAAVASNNFKTSYVMNIEKKDDLIDWIIAKRPDPIDENQVLEAKPILVAKADIGNSVFGLIVISVIIFPLILLLPITVTFTIWSAKVKRYIIEPTRVLGRTGIFYKKQTSILFNKIDHINFKQGAINKMFKNGTIVVNTVGSSTPELIMTTMHDFQNFFDELKKYY
ncbi:MAG: PH domain-containing protein [Nanoarchaeota archaeon]|nr:PH domain-containing protein [Nanoarchaeota archaeon]